MDSMDKVLGRFTTQDLQAGAYALFLNIMDIAALAAYIIHTANNDTVSRKTNNLRLFFRN